MTKKKVVLFVCLLVFAVLLVLNATVFTVKNIEVLDAKGVQSEEDKVKIADYSGIRGKNIFTVSERIATENIEKMMPKVKVEEIIRRSPWAVEIVVSERIAIIAVKNTNNGYAIIDKDGKVLENVSDLSSFSHITVLNGVDPVNASIGQTVPLTATQLGRIKQIVMTFEQMGDNGYRDKNFCLAVSAIAFDSDAVSILMRRGAELRYNANEDSANKLFALVSFFNSNEEKRDSGVYTVNGKDTSGKYIVVEAQN